MEILLNKNGKQEGPFDMERVNALLTTGQISSNDLAWFNGCSEWIKVSAIPGVFSNSNQVLNGTSQTFPDDLGSDFKNKLPGSQRGKNKVLVDNVKIKKPFYFETGLILTLIFRILGVLEIIGGICMAVYSLPGDPGEGYSWKFPMYLPSLFWLIPSIAVGLILMAIADFLGYLFDIRDSLIRNNPMRD